jgi:hypothetical protein
MLLFISVVPITKLFARGEGDSGGHVLRETTSRGLCGLVCPSRIGTREEPGTSTQGGVLFSLVPLVWESNPKLQGGWCKPNHQPSGDLEPGAHPGAVCLTLTITLCCCCFSYCSTYYRAVHVGFSVVYYCSTL